MSANRVEIVGWGDVPETPSDQVHDYKFNGSQRRSLPNSISQWRRDRSQKKSQDLQAIML
jgi:hypothetical protein